MMSWVSIHSTEAIQEVSRLWWHITTIGFENHQNRDGVQYSLKSMVCNSTWLKPVLKYLSLALSSS